MDDADTDNTPQVAAQDPLAELLAPYHAKGAPYLAAHQGELATLRDNPPTTVDDRFACGFGRMAPDKDRPGDGTQLPDTVEHKAWTLRDMFAWVKAKSRICPKFDAPCFYTAVPAIPGSSKKTNFHHSSLVALDLDGTIKDPAGLARLRRWCALYACILYSSARHDPENGIYRLRIVLLLRASLTYEEHRRVARSICILLGSYLGTTEGIDTCTERAFQPMLLPGWRDARIAAQVIVELSEGEAMSVVVPLADARQEIEQAAAQVRGRGTAAATMRSSSPRSIAAAEGADGLDREARAVAELPVVPAGAGQSDRGLWGAACVLRDWEVCEDRALEIMVAQYGGSHAEERIRHKIADAYRGDHPSRGWRFRAAMAEQPLSLDQVGEFELQGPETVAMGACEAVEGVGVDGGGSADTCPVALNSVKRKAPDECYRAEAASQVVPSTAPIPRTTRRHEDARYLPPIQQFCELQARVTYRKSACGTGKNESLRPAIQQALQDPRQRVVTLSHRISLARAQSADWIVPCYQDAAGDLVDSRTVCLDSIPRVVLSPSLDLDAPEVELTVIIDEAQQVFQHLYADTILGKGVFGSVWSSLRSLLRAATRIIVQDADLDIFSIFALRVLLGWHKQPSQISEQIHINRWRPPPVPVHVYLRLEEQYWTDLLEACSRGPVFEFCTAKAVAAWHATALQIAYPNKRILTIKSDTTTTDDVALCVLDPTKALEWQRWDIVIVTTSLGTGVSINTPDHFAVFGHCQSGAGPDAHDVKQGLSRVRRPLGCWRIFVGGPVVSGDTNPERILGRLHERSDVNFALLRDQTWTAARRPDGELEISVDNPDALLLHAEVLAMGPKYGNFAPREIKDDQGVVLEVKPGALLDHLEEACSAVLVYQDDTLTEDQRKAANETKKLAKSVVDEQKAIALLNAIRRTYEEAREMASTGKTWTPEAYAEVQAASIRHTYDAELTRELIDRDDDGARRGQLRSYNETLAVQRGEQEAVARLDWRDFQAGFSSQVEGKAIKGIVKAKLWAAAGIHDLEKDAEAGTVLKDPGLIGAFRDDVARNAVKTHTDLKISDAEAKHRMRFFRKLAEQDGLKLEPEQYKDELGKVRRRYRLERGAAQLMALDARAEYERLIEPPKRKASDWERRLDDLLLNKDNNGDTP